VRLAELREKMAEKRARKAVEEVEEHKANEILRRKAAKVGGLDLPTRVLPEWYL
jgi:hypothetical protein